MAAERRGGRCEWLIRAANALYGDRGYRRIAVCQAADLTPGYFHEAVVRSEALLLAILERVSDDVAWHVEAAGAPNERRLAEAGDWHPAHGPRAS